MTQRRRKKKAATPTVKFDWSPEVAKLFGVIPEDWEPPTAVRAWGNLSKSTWVAVFRMPDGQANRVRVRLQRCPEGGQEVVEKSIDMTLKFDRRPR